MIIPEMTDGNYNIWKGCIKLCIESWYGPFFRL